MPSTPIPNLLVACLVVAAAGLGLLLPPGVKRLRGVAVAATTLGLLGVVSFFEGAGGLETARVLFWVFTAATFSAAVLMLAARDPVHGALWFAVTTLGVCGLFVLLSAPFLAAATVIVYAGAIIVTFLFVIMLAQQSGSTGYDQRSRSPKAAVFIAALVLGGLVMNLHQWRKQVDPTVPAVAASEAHPLSIPTAATPQGSLWALGRSMFGDYLFSVELAGTLLLIATVGAIVMAPRRQQGTL